MRIQMYIKNILVTQTSPLPLQSEKEMAKKGHDRQIYPIYSLGGSGVVGADCVSPIGFVGSSTEAT